MYKAVQLNKKANKDKVLKKIEQKYKEITN
jgi:uncharacterized lipoprotein YehR (DUF1307 family)